MALHHAASGEIVNIRPLGKELKQAISITLVKTDHLQVFRYILLKGSEFAEHKVPGEITVQCLEGVVEFTSRGRKQTLRAGEFVYLTSEDPHALKGLEDASVLVTIVSDKR
ncbi:MAG: cupin domain-containing protein [Sulfuricaulis sp.]|nr:cupin domain-containing protein [Sulfuricaulis sp.]